MNKQTEKTLSERLKELRKNANMTQEKLGEKLGIDGDTYGNYEREKTYPSTDVIVALAQIYDVTTDYILTGKEIDVDAKVSSLINKCPDNKLSGLLAIIEGIVGLIN